MIKTGFKKIIFICCFLFFVSIAFAEYSVSTDPVKSNEQSTFYDYSKETEKNIKNISDLVNNKLHNKVKPNIELKQYHTPSYEKKEDNSNNAYVTIWFDDGWKSVAFNAEPVMLKYNYKGVFAIVMDNVNLHAMVDWAEIKLLSDQGWEIASHTFSHYCKFSKYNKNTIGHEITESKEYLEGQGFYIESFSMPCGFNTSANELLDDTIKRNYTFSINAVLFGINDLPVHDSHHLRVICVDNETDIEWLKKKLLKAKKARCWVILLFHMVGQEHSHSKYNIPQKSFDTILKFINKENFNVVLPSEMAKFIAAD